MEWRCVMKGYTIPVHGPVRLVMTGKFEASSEDWMHLSRVMTDYELIVVTEGTLYIGADGERHTVERGEYLLLPPKTEQYGWRTSKCAFYWLHFLEGEQAGDSGERIAIPEKKLLVSPDKLTVMMKQLQDSVRSYNEKHLNNYMASAILCELYNQTRSEPGGARPRPRQEQLFYDIQDYISYRRTENIRVSEVARHFGYNSKYLSELFAGLAGVPLKRYIIQQRMEAAKHLLTDTNASIGEIAARLHYSDAHHFMKAFKKNAGLTPSEFRGAFSRRILNRE